MLKDTKPKIVYRAEGSPFLPYSYMTWVCISRFGYGSGKTPDVAYREWDTDRAKTFHGKIINILLDKAYDHPTTSILLVFMALFMAMVSPVFFRS
jgi:hypothetical protein